MLNYETVRIGKAVIEKNEGHEVYHFTCGTVSITIWPTSETMLFSGEKEVRIGKTNFPKQVWINP